MTQIVIEQLKKTFGDAYALGPLSISFSEKDVVAVLGKNGAGKTTFFQILTGNMDATDGRILMNGESVRPDAYQLKKNIGYLPQHLGLPMWVSAKELLSYAMKISGYNTTTSSVEKILAYWDCAAFMHKPMAACSHGMQKRVGLALATFHNPELLVLDEPFSGLDIYHIKALEDVLENRRKEGRCTFISTHIAPYAARFCNRALFLVAGRGEEALTWPGMDASQRVAHVEHFFFS